MPEEPSTALATVKDNKISLFAVNLEKLNFNFSIKDILLFVCPKRMKNTLLHSAQTEREVQLIKEGSKSFDLDNEELIDTKSENNLSQVMTFDDTVKKSITRILESSPVFREYKYRSGDAFPITAKMKVSLTDSDSIDKFQRCCGYLKEMIDNGWDDKEPEAIHMLTSNIGKNISERMLLIAAIHMGCEVKRNDGKELISAYHNSYCNYGVTYYILPPINNLRKTKQ